MSAFSGESKYPNSDKWNSYGKFLFWAIRKRIVDFAKGMEFMLSGVIFVNANQVFNDNTYEHPTVGFPFLHQLGQLSYNYEKQRPKKIKPDLSKFRVRYK